MESKINLQAQAVSGNATASGDRAPARWHRATFERVSPLSRTFEALSRKLVRTKEKLADVFADRSLLVARIKDLESRLHRIQLVANHDELTGLPNRRLLQDRYAQAVVRSEREGDNVAVLFIDIDRFKRINDAFGHVLADRMLQQLALRITSCIRASDTACRYGGDEFVVLLSGNRKRAAAVATAAKIRERLSEPVFVDSRTLQVTVSIGTALYPMDGSGLSSLVMAADRHMYLRKGEFPADIDSSRERARENEAFTNEGAPPEEKL